MKFDIRGKKLTLQAIWIAKRYQTMGPIARWGRYLVNHDGTCDYGISATRPKSGPIKSTGGIAKRRYRGKEPRTFKQFRGKMHGGGPKIVFRKMRANLGKTGAMKQNLEERQARLSKVDGVSLKGDSEQIRTGWCKAENKPACFEYGNTDRFKDQFHIWLEKAKRWTNVAPTSGTKGAKPKGGTQPMEKERGGRLCFLLPGNK